MFVLAMLLYPDIARKGQEEIDAVVGSERLPDFSDRESLPFVESIVQETLRWDPTVPIGVPHYSTEDSTYRGMFIPKDTILVANTRGMALDEGTYKNPQCFMPERFLPFPQGGGEPPLTAAFGFGRRKCPGRHLAESSLFIAIARILATFDIARQTGPDGKPIVPPMRFSNGLAKHADLGICDIQPRSIQARELITRSF